MIVGFAKAVDFDVVYILIIDIGSAFDRPDSCLLLMNSSNFNKYQILSVRAVLNASNELFLNF